MVIHSRNYYGAVKEQGRCLWTDRELLPLAFDYTARLVAELYLAPQPVTESR